MVRYEDLLDNTLSELTKVYEFLEIKIDEATLREIVERYSFDNIISDLKGKFARSSSQGKWKKNFNCEEKAIMEKIMGPTLNKMGYF